MHELGVVFEVIKTVENFALENELTQIDTIVLQIGEFSSMIPSYIEACYPAAIDGTRMQDTKLQIEILPANALCRKCKIVFNIKENQGLCPDCCDNDWEMLSGKEFMIKEIIAF